VSELSPRQEQWYRSLLSTLGDRHLTAANKLTEDTMDMRGTTDIDGMLGLLEHYCIKNRQHSFSRAVEALVKELYPKRMTHMLHKHE
jgi:hypothetical protein